MGVAGTMFVFSRGLECGAVGIGPWLTVSLCKDVPTAGTAPGLVCASGWVRWVNFHMVIPIEFVRDQSHVRNPVVTNSACMMTVSG